MKIAKFTLLVAVALMITSCGHRAGYYQSKLNGKWYWVPESCENGDPIGDDIYCTDSDGNRTGIVLHPATHEEMLIYFEQERQIEAAMQQFNQSMQQFGSDMNRLGQQYRDTNYQMQQQMQMQQLNRNLNNINNNLNGIRYGY